MVVTRDARQLRDKNVQSTRRQDFVGWLKPTTSLLHTSNSLSSIHAKGYKLIFRHLVLIIDDAYMLPDIVPLQDEVLISLRALDRPYVSSLEFKRFAAPASMHS